MLYGSSAVLERELLAHDPRARRLLRSGFIEYIGDSLSFGQMAQLYQAADAYVSPYRGEGFNMPVLEAAATGLVVVATLGGATDDFTNASFALGVDSREEEFDGLDGALREGAQARWRLPDGCTSATQRLPRMEPHAHRPCPCPREAHGITLLMR